LAHLTAAAQREEKKQVPEPELGQEVVAAAVQEWPSELGQEAEEEVVAEVYMEP
jgi:hypothetical protein